MDPGYLTPFLDMLKHGQTDRDIRLMAAQARLGLRPDEQRGVLELLAGDPDREVAQAAAVSSAPGVAPESPPEPDEEKGELPDRTSEEVSAAGKGVIGKLAVMNPAERLARAMKGSREERAVL